MHPPRRPHLLPFSSHIRKGNEVMTKKQGGTLHKVLGTARLMPETILRAMVMNLESGEQFGIDPQAALALGVSPSDAYALGDVVGEDRARRVAEQAMAGLRMFLDEIPFELAIAEVSGLVLATSGSFLPGLMPADTIGRNVCDFLEAKHHRRVLTRYEESIRSGQIFYERELVELEAGRFSLDAYCLRSTSGKVLVLASKQAVRIDPIAA